MKLNSYMRKVSVGGEHDRKEVSRYNTQLLYGVVYHAIAFWNKRRMIEGFNPFHDCYVP